MWLCNANKNKSCTTSCSHCRLNNQKERRSGWLEQAVASGRCNISSRDFSPKLHYPKCLACPESVESRLRLRIQTWQRHHGLLEPLRETDERGENVHIGVTGESNEYFLCVSRDPHRCCVTLPLAERGVCARGGEREGTNRSRSSQRLLACLCRR